MSKGSWLSMGEQVGKLGFGAAIGSGFGGIIYIVLSYYSPTKVPVEVFYYSGMAVGLGLNQIVDKLYDKMIAPVTKTLGFYFNLGQILALKKMHVLEEAKAKEYIDKLNEVYFLGNNEMNTVVLPAPRQRRRLN